MKAEISIPPNLKPLEEAITAIEARDWVELADDANGFNDNGSNYPSTRVSYMKVVSGLNWPTSSGVVVSDPRGIQGLGSDYLIQTFYSLNVSHIETYRRFMFGGVIPAWQKVITSQTGVISDQLNLSGLTEYADDTAAGLGGLVADDLYTTTGTIKIKL